MNTDLLEAIGLTAAQAAAYKALVEHGATTAPDLAAYINESRTNTYKILDRLCELSIASKDDSGVKLRYIPASPAALEQLIHRQSEELSLRQRKLQAEMPTMLDYFFAHTEQPAIRFYQGREGMRQIFSDMLATGETLYFVRSPEDVNFYNEEFFIEIRKKRRLLGIKTVGITPDIPTANHDPAIDAQNLFTRTWIQPDQYTAKVEWNIAGDKVALISYGAEAIGVVIENKQIAESFRQVFSLAAANSTAAK